MAPSNLSARNRAFLRNRRERPVAHRPLVGSAVPLKLTDKVEARRLRVLRQGWQEDALSYVDALPELSFAYRFMQHCSARMRWYPAIVNEEDPGGPPIPLKDAPGVPQGVMDVANAAMNAIGVSGRALSPIQQSLSYNLGVPGECFIVGHQDDAGMQHWKIRSIDEFMVYEDQYKLREVPLDPQGILGWIDVDPTKTYAARLWDPHPRFQLLATSPMRALLDVAEELLLLSRDVRAVARSRLAGAGILKVPEGLRMMSFGQDNADALSDEWFGRFAELMMTPISEEGVASAVVPIAISGESEALAGLDHLLLDRPFSPLAMELRAEAIGRLATGLDIPREVLEGMSDPNHWGAWLVSDDTFRHHIEPQVITQVDTFSQGYMRPWMMAADLPQYWTDRVCTWYDPVDLITKPDPATNAILAHDRMAISNKALVEALGFSVDDMPTPLEMEIRMITKLHSFPPNVLEALIHALDPDIVIPPIAGGGQVPGMGPKGAIQPTEPGTGGAAPGAAAPPEVPTGGPPAPAAIGPSTSAPPAPAAAMPTGQAAAASMATAPAKANANAQTQRLSRKLAEIDRDLRTRIQSAACASMMQLLDRAGAKLRTRAANRKFADDAARDRIKPAEVTNREVASLLTEPVVASMGYASSLALLDPNWEELGRQFAAWVKAGQQAALKTACQMAGITPANLSAQLAQAKMEAAIEPAWAAFEAELNAIAEKLLYNPTPGAKTELNVDPNTVVPAGLVRRALGVAGGGKPAKGIVAAIDFPTQMVDPGQAQMFGQIGTGEAIAGLLDDADLVPIGYTWVHGPALRPFEPHEDLDGTDFTSFTDDVLANTGDFPDNEYYFPGDHDGCSCDFTTQWGTSAEAAAAEGDEDVAATEDEGDDTDGGDIDPDLSLSDVADMIANLSGHAGPKSMAAAGRDLNAARDTMSVELAQTKTEAQNVLDRMGAKAVQRPAALTRDISGTHSVEGGEYDWYYQLSSQERDRLRNNGWVVDDLTAPTPDVVHAGFASGGMATDSTDTVDDAMQTWLEQTRKIDAVNLLASKGSLPGNLERFGSFDFNSLAPDSTYSVKGLFAPKTDAIEYLAQARSSEAAELAERTLTGKYGQPIWNMTYGDYEDEVNALALQLENVAPIAEDDEWGETYDAATQARYDRLDELLPEALMPAEGEPDLDLIYRQAQQIAQWAGLKG